MPGIVKKTRAASYAISRTVMRRPLFARWLLRVVRPRRLQWNRFTEPNAKSLSNSGRERLVCAYLVHPRNSITSAGYRTRIRVHGTTIGIRVNIDLSLGYDSRSISVRIFPLASGSIFGGLLTGPPPSPQVSTVSELPESSSPIYQKSSLFHRFTCRFNQLRHVLETTFRISRNGRN